MLRLWPERYTLNLFGKQSWLRVNQRVHEAGAETGDVQDLLAIADRLLSFAPVSGTVQPSLDVLVSNEKSRVVLLPWQERVRTAAQQLSYAEACLADSGVLIDGGWIVQAGFRRYGGVGLGLAMPREFVDGLRELAISRRLRIRSVMPLSAAAYWQHRPKIAGEALLLLREDQRVTSMRYLGKALDSIDVQPIGGDWKEATLRLLRRHMKGRTPGHIACWSSAGALMVDDLPKYGDTTKDAVQLPRIYWD